MSAESAPPRASVACSGRVFGIVTPEGRGPDPLRGPAARAPNCTIRTASATGCSRTVTAGQGRRPPAADPSRRPTGTVVAMRSRRAPRTTKAARLALAVAAIVYLAVGAWLVFGPPPGETSRAVGDGVQLAEDRLIQDGSRVDVAVDRLDSRVTSEEVNNLLLFLPVPILASLASPRWWWLSVPLGVAASIGIEAVQRRYLDQRSPTWNDVRWNSAGLLVGAALVVAAMLALSVVRQLRRPVT